MDGRDSAILSAFPLHAVAPVAGYSPAADSGTRYLASAEGLWREINLPWIRVLHLIAPSVLQLPYGRLQPEVEVKCGAVPTALLREFNSWAREEAPQEIAAAILWNETTEEWRLARRIVRSASPGHVEFDEVQPEDGEHLVIDIHSHGHYPAFFSAEDNRDDFGSMKFSLVVGSFNQTQPTSVMRLCMAGAISPARVDSQGQMLIINEEGGA